MVGFQPSSFPVSRRCGCLSQALVSPLRWLPCALARSVALAVCSRLFGQGRWQQKGRLAPAACRVPICVVYVQRGLINVTAAM